MKIFYTVPFHGKEKYQEYYDEIMKTLLKSDVEVISPENSTYLDLILPTDPIKNETRKHIHYEAIRRGIETADAVVFEISHECFQLGHEMTLAIQAKKHVLCLSLHENFERKIFSKYFHGAKYDLKTLNVTIENFLKKCRKEQLPNRFNLFMSTNQIQFLEKKAKFLNVSVSEYIRELIDKQRDQGI